MGHMKETDLYQPVKTLLEDQGYTVKGEIGKCDVVGRCGLYRSAPREDEALAKNAPRHAETV